MKLVPTETTLVIAGAWNPAIVTPNWVLKFGLEVPAGTQSMVQAFLPAVQGFVFDTPKYVVNGITFSVRPDALVFASETVEGFERIEAVAARIVGHLKHTPVRGVGHNFEFRDTEPTSAHLDVFTVARQDLADRVPDGWEPSSSTVSASFTYGSNFVVNITRQFEANQISVKFNFHHALTDAEDVVALLRGDGHARMAQNLDAANHLINQLYGEDEHAQGV